MKLRITVEGRAYEVEVEVLDDTLTHRPPSSVPLDLVAHKPASPAHPAAEAPVASGGPPVFSTTSDRVVKAPIVGTVMTIKVKPGDSVEVNQVLLVMEAMKMETNIASPIAGRVKNVLTSSGMAVKAGQVLVELE